MTEWSRDTHGGGFHCGGGVRGGVGGGGPGGVGGGVFLKLIICLMYSACDFPVLEMILWLWLRTEAPNKAL